MEEENDAIERKRQNGKEKQERERERSVARGRRKYRELSSASARERGGRKNEKKRGDEIIKDQEEGGVSVERGEKEERERERRIGAEG